MSDKKKRDLSRNTKPKSVKKAEAKAEAPTAEEKPAEVETEVVEPKLTGETEFKPVIEEVPGAEFDAFQVPTVEREYTKHVSAPTKEIPSPTSTQPAPAQPTGGDPGLNIDEGAEPVDLPPQPGGGSITDGMVEEPGGSPEPEFDDQEQIINEFDEFGGGMDGEMSHDQAKKTADSIISMFNYGAENFGGILTDLKMQEEYKVIEGMEEAIEKQNAQNRKHLPLNKDEIGMVRPPLIDVIREENIEMTAKARLGIALAMIAGNKAGTIMTIRKENRALEERLIQRIQDQFAEQEEEPESKPKK